MNMNDVALQYVGEMAQPPCRRSSPQPTKKPEAACLGTRDHLNANSASASFVKDTQPSYDHGHSASWMLDMSKWMPRILGFN